MGQQLPIPQAVVYEANLILHGEKVHDLGEVVDGVEHLMDIAAKHNREGEARLLAHLSVDAHLSGCHPPGALVREARSIRDHPELVIDPQRCNPSEQYDPGREVHWYSA